MEKDKKESHAGKKNEVRAMRQKEGVSFQELIDNVEHHWVWIKF